jgi:diguanylate cyclase (GGDEF)-like protein
MTQERLSHRVRSSTQPLVTWAEVGCTHFAKQYNDFYGHVGGDDCLRRVAGALTAGLRDGDTAARYGGEEFAIVVRPRSRTARISGSKAVVSAHATVDQDDRRVSLAIAVTPSRGTITHRLRQVAPPPAV